MLALLRCCIPDPILSMYHFFLARLAAFVYRYPSEQLIVIGVTGTNGKTTVSYLIAKALEASGERVGMTSTALLKIGDREWLNGTKMTMPGRFFLQRMLRDMVRAGCRYAVIETSSQGLVQHRHQGIVYDMAAFTNLTPEHIEAHGGFEAYKAAKGILFSAVAKRGQVKTGVYNVPPTVVLNAGSEHATFYAECAKGARVVWYGVKGKKGLVPEEVQVMERGSDIVVEGAYGHLALPGMYNVENALAALATAQVLGIPVGSALARICAVPFVPGRFEEVSLGQSFRAIIDYAPEPESLRQLYGALALTPRKRLIHVLGSCGGGRDVARRAILGDMAAKEADIVIVTNEDPYDDNPREIIEMVAQGARQAGKQEGKELFLIDDRAEAIEYAVGLAQEGDVVLLTGKGAETWICVADGKKLPWSERITLEGAIQRKLAS